MDKAIGVSISNWFRKNNNRFYAIAILLAFSFSCNAQFVIDTQVNWQAPVTGVITYSSPRSCDLNGDGVKDIVISDGIEWLRIGHVQAFDGTNGQTLWSVYRDGDIYGSAQFHDVNSDGTKDVIIGGRQKLLLCINGLSGDVIWQFDTLQATTDPLGWLQFYEPKTVRDLTGDGIRDLVIINGGDPTAPPFIINRRPAHLLALDATTGLVLHSAVVPDSAESYTSVVVNESSSDDSTFIFFGTGGETAKGSIWRASLTSLLNDNINSAIELVSGINKGFITPVSLADLNQDGVLDIVAAGMDGIATAIDGQNHTQLWYHLFPGCETYSNPAIGKINSDAIPDVFFSFNLGVFPQYSITYQYFINGANGNILRTDSSGVNICSPIAYDIDNDGNDEFMQSANISYGFDGTYLTLHDFETPIVNNVTTTPNASNIASTPFLDDLNDDGLLELAEVAFTDTNDYQVTLRNTNIPKLPSFHWSAYHGANYDGIYPINTSVAIKNTDKNQLTFYQMKDIITINNATQASLTDITGRIIEEVKAEAGRVSFSLSNFTNGTYIVKAQNNNQQIFRKFITYE